MSVAVVLEKWLKGAENVICLSVCRFPYRRGGNMEVVCQDTGTVLALPKKMVGSV